MMLKAIIIGGLVLIVLFTGLVLYACVAAAKRADRQMREIKYQKMQAVRMKRRW